MCGCFAYGTTGLCRSSDNDEGSAPPTERSLYSEACCCLLVPADCRSEQPGHETVGSVESFLMVAGSRCGGCRPSGWRVGAGPGGGSCRGRGAGRANCGPDS